MFVGGGREPHGSGLVVDSDQSTVGVNIAVAAGQLVSISGLLLGDVSLLSFVSNLVLKVVLGTSIHIVTRVAGTSTCKSSGG